MPLGHRAAAVPSHHIPLDEAGETVETMELKENQHELEEKLKNWLRQRIQELEAERAAMPAA